MEILSAVAAKIAALFVEPIGQWLRYSFDYDSNFKTLEKQVGKLRDARENVQHSVDAAIRNGEAIERVVNNWLKEVDEITKLANKVLESEERASTTCCNGACLDLKLRHQLSQKAKEIAQRIDKTLEGGGRFVRVGYRAAPQGILTTRPMDYVDSESRKSTVKRIMEALRDDNIHVLGVWGMAGVGKSTLVREVAYQAYKDRLFDGVAWANVTQSPNRERIQGEIADTLGIEFVAGTELGRADRLWEILSQDRNKRVILDDRLENLDFEERLTKTKDKKKILVILDDIWVNLDLKEIGIPTKVCKVLLTSRDRDVLRSKMETQKDFGLGVLAKEEAWSLFEKMAGECVNRDPNLRCIATEVAKECAGLPLALVTVSQALKNKSSYVWKDALQQLRKLVPKHPKTILSTIYSSIELSYKHLENKEVQDVFLLCAQQNYCIHKMDLLKYCYGLGLLHGINTMEDARNRISTIVDTLKDCSLLLHNPIFEQLRMHDVVRDAAKLIASRDHNMLVMRANDELKDADALKRCEILSFLGRDIHELPNELKCPELRFLFVSCDEYRPFQISDTFFEGMGKLKVLYWTKMQLSSLPSSLCHLRDLQTLCLDNCVLENIAVIGELKNLVILSLLKSQISQLPRKIGLLTRLRLLDLSDCSELKVIPPNVLSSLVALEELYMRNSFIQWEAKGLNNASLVELKHLSHLITLEIHIPNASNLPKNLSFEKFERYVILVGDEWDWPDRQGEDSRTLKLKLKTSFYSEVGIKMLLKRTENLYLDELKGVKSVLNELDLEGFQQLKHLHIQNNAEIKCIISSRTSHIAFPALETILLKNMISLEEIICHGRFQKAFGNLRVVKVKQCDKLKFVFPSSIARGLSQLEELEIRECSMMGAIVIKEEGETEDTDLALFPQLRCLALKHLPKLMSFLSTQNSLTTDDAGEIILEAKPDFYMPILHEQVVFPNLETLQLSSIGLEDIHRATWSSCRLDMQSTSRFQNLLKLKVKGCGNIKYLLSFSTAKFMVHLKSLHILECKAMEEILLTEDLGVVEEIIPKVLFPRLEGLFLKELPLLERFCQGSNIKFPSLNLVIDHCPKLKTFISKMNTEESPHTPVQPLFNEEVAFPSLERLVVSHVDDFKIIWRNQFAMDSFYKLQVLVVAFCKNLVNVFQSDMLASFQSLEKLTVRDCGSLEEVFELEELNVTETPAKTTIQLKELNLCRLPKMKHVWNKDPQEIFSFQNLKDIHAIECESLKSLFPASVARCLTQLEKLYIVDCGVLKEIVAGEEGAEAITRFVFPQVSNLRLDGLRRLKCFYPGRHASEWPMLKNMYVRGCHKVDIFASRLLSEIVEESQLEISVKQPLFLVDEVVFPNLETLQLSSIGLEDIQHNQHRATTSSCRLESMQSTSRFQNLLNLEVKGCGNIKYLLSFSTAKFMVHLKYLGIAECKAMEEILLTEDSGVVEEIIPQLEDLVLKELPILERFCQGSNIKFPCLKQLLIENCPKLKTFISKPVGLGMTTSCKELKEMNTEESPQTSVQPLFNEKVAFPSLERLLICHVDDIKIMWRNQFAVGSFYKLQSLKVLFCKNLVNVFQSDMLARFQSLEELVVTDCGSLEDVFGLEGLNVTEAHAVTAIQLKKLHLNRLPKMKHVWNRDPQQIFSFQNLKDIHAEECESLKSLFPASVARCLTQLEKLYIVDCGVLKEIVAGEEGAEAITRFVFPQVSNLRLDGLRRLKCFYPGRHASEWPMLKDMYVRGCHKVDIFASQLEISVKQPLFLVDEVVFPNLETLQLFSIGLEDIQHNQHRATTSSCRLENMQSTSRFQNLLKLMVYGCGNIKYLLSFSTAKFMVHLKSLNILECKAMEEILLTEDFGVVEEISFPRLEDLVLKKLPILERFCQGSNIKFPSLKKLEIDYCPKLKTFISKPVSLGMMTSCKEHKEMNTEESPHTAVQPLFNEEVAFPSLETLLISHVDDLKIIWRNQFAVDSFYKLQVLKVLFCKNLVNVFQSDMLARFQSLEELSVRNCPSLQAVFEVQGIDVKEMHAVTTKDPKPIFSFQNLQRVGVVGCGSLKSIFPAFVATCLTQLEQLVVVGCKILEEIVAGEEAEQPIAKFVFPQVTVLHLVELRRLKWFYRGVHTSEWPMLKDMLVAGCPKVEIFASELSSFQDILLRESKLEITIKQPLFLVDEVPFPSLEKLRISCMLDLKIIWHSQFTADSFCKPQIIKVEYCRNLPVQETHAVTATQLKELHLLHLPKLKHIWNKDPQQIFSFAMGCESMDVRAWKVPKIQSVLFDEYEVKEIVLRNENSSESYPSGVNT